MANQKRISELPIINALSGSSVSVIPVVVGGTTNQISAERFSEFVNAYNATTSSNTFIGNQTITGDLDVSGNATIGGDVEVAGMITAQQYNVTYVSSSIQYKSGSTEFGDTADDTHIFTGTIVLNGLALGTPELMAQTASQNSINTGISAVTGAFATELGSIDSHILKQSTQTGSQDLVNLRISSTTGSINTTTSSFDSVFLRISSTTGSINTTTSSFNSVFLGISSVTGAMNTQSSSQDLVNLGISSVTGSLIGITNGLMAFTASLDNTYATDAQLYQLYQATRSLEIQTGSQNSINSGISAVTGAFATELGSIDSHILKQASQTGSQDLVNLGISTYTGSNELWKAGVRGELSGLEAWTASLDSTYATDAQVAAAVAGLNTQTGSQDLVNLGISSSTGSIITQIGELQTQNNTQTAINFGISVATASLRDEIGGIEAYTASLKSVALVSGSLIASSSYSIVSDGARAIDIFQSNTNVEAYPLFANVVGAAGVAVLGDNDLTYNAFTNTLTLGTISATKYLGDIVSSSAQIGEIVGLQQATASLNTFTGSIRDEVNGLEAYTASLKSVALVSGSAQLIPTFVQNSLTSSMSVGAANTVTVASSTTTTDSTLYPTFTNNIVNATVQLKSHPNGTFYYDGVTRKVYSESFVGGILEATGSLIATGSTLLSGSTQIIGNQQITGSLLVTGSLTISSGSITMPNRPAFRVVGTSTSDRTGVYTMSGSNFTIDYNEGNHFNITDGKFTAPIDGLYQVYLNARCGSVDAQQQIIVYKNGTAGTTQLMWEAPGNTGVAHFGVSGIVRLVAGDTLEATVTVGSISFDGNDSWGVAYIG